MQFSIEFHDDLLGTIADRALKSSTGYSIALQWHRPKGFKCLCTVVQVLKAGAASPPTKFTVKEF